jgi:pimeloyl-ACP methyl ester carboxylesterase
MADATGPTVVLVHGGFADGSGWRGVYDLLKQDGHDVRIVQEPNLSLEGDVEATKMITGAQSEPVVLVGHSYGGAVITEAGNHPDVTALVYIAAFAPDAGESVETLLGTFPPDEPNAGDAILPPQDGFLFLDRADPPRPAKRRRRAHRSLSGGPGGEGCLRGSVPFLYGNQVMHLELYRLLTILEASPALADFEGSDESDKQQVDFLRRGHEFAEVSRIVVSLAAIIRSEITAIPLADKGYYDLPLNRPVGVLRSDLSVPGASEDLYFREACNKILHADQVNPEQTPDNGALTG